MAFHCDCVISEKIKQLFYMFALCYQAADMVVRQCFCISPLTLFLHRLQHCGRALSAGLLLLHSLPKKSKPVKVYLLQDCVLLHLWGWGQHCFHLSSLSCCTGSLVSCGDFTFLSERSVSIAMNYSYTQSFSRINSSPGSEQVYLGENIYSRFNIVFVGRAEEETSADSHFSQICLPLFSLLDTHCCSFVDSFQGFSVTN